MAGDSIGPVLLRSIHRDDLSCCERGCCREFLCELSCGFVGALLYLSSKDRNQQEIHRKIHSSIHDKIPSRSTLNEKGATKSTLQGGRADK